MTERKHEHDEVIDPLKTLGDLIKCVEKANPHYEFYFARHGEIKAAIKIFKDSNVVVVDSRGRKWLHGERIMEEKE